MFNLPVVSRRKYKLLEEIYKVNCEHLVKLYEENQRLRETLEESRKELRKSVAALH